MNEFYWLMNLICMTRLFEWHILISSVLVVPEIPLVFFKTIYVCIMRVLVEPTITLTLSYAFSASYPRGIDNTANTLWRYHRCFKFSIYGILAGPYRALFSMEDLLNFEGSFTLQTWMWLAIPIKHNFDKIDYSHLSCVNPCHWGWWWRWFF